jgi:hypothetical protein
MAAQVAQIRIQGSEHGATLDGTDGRAGKLCEPFLSPSLRLVIFERFPEGLILLLLVAPAEARMPGIGTSPESQIGAGGEPLPVRVATQRQRNAGAFPRQIHHAPDDRMKWYEKSIRDGG